ncbi:MAG TPA: glycosyltransferase [archaeon]|nr:glycosyltransferase [archaeon]
MRAAIFHNSLTQKGGAEKLVLCLANELKADIITPFFDPEILSYFGYPKQKVIVINPFFGNHWFTDISSILAFSFCDFSRNYDAFIFSGAITLFAAKKHSPSLYYSHYEILNGLLKPVFAGIMLPMRVVSNSKRTQKKLFEEFGIGSDVIYPPIDVKSFFPKKSMGYWLSVNRLHEQKRIELQLEAFRFLPEKKLFIVGEPISEKNSKYKKFLEKNKPENVQFLQTKNRSELIALYSNCEGFIATSQDEPFGMSVVEALASGKPVVCVDEGGYRETVIEGKTGFLVSADPVEICAAIKKVSQNPGKYRIACTDRAKEFDASLFFEKIRRVSEF